MSHREPLRAACLDPAPRGAPAPDGAPALCWPGVGFGPAVEAEVLVLRVGGVVDVAAAVATRQVSSAPALCLAERPAGERSTGLLVDRLSELLAALPEGDELAWSDEPPALLALRAHRLASRSGGRDPLTQLLTKRAFRGRLLARCAGPRAAPLSLLSIDLDHFKRINDEHGHTVGDQALAALAERLRALVPASSALARVGGEELALLHDGGAQPALALAERLRAAVRAAPVLVGTDEIALTVSIGVASVAGGGEPGPAAAAAAAEALRRGADGALLAAKARGRDRVLHLEQVEREALERDVPLQAAKLEDLTRVITERAAAALTHHGRRLFQEIREQAELDGLTGLYSRRYFDQRLRAELAAARADGQALAVALLDVDHFGAVNKTHGWPAGDQVLVEVANRVARSVRSQDWVARYGGEELAIVMRGLAPAHLGAVLERVRAAVAATPIELRGGGQLAVTASIGAAALAETDLEPAALLDRVSPPLLAAKRQGRNRVCVAAGVAADERGDAAEGTT